MPHPPKPPLLGRLLFRLRRLGDRRTDVRQDLLELFEKRVGVVGTAQARRRYIHDVISLWMTSANSSRSRRSRMSVSRWLGGALQDARFGLRVFRHQAAGVGLSLVGLAVAIGLATSAFTVTNAFNFKPVGVAEPERAARAHPPLSPDDFKIVQAGARTAKLEGSIHFRPSVTSTTGASLGRAVPMRFVTDTFLPTFGAEIAYGRPFVPDDARPGATPAAILSHGYWRTFFASDRNVIGQSLVVNHQPVVVVGVLEAGFTGPFNPTMAPAMWLPLQAVATVNPGTVVDPIEIAVHLSRPGIGEPTAHELTSLAGVTMKVAHVGPELTDDDEMMLWVTGAIVGLVVLLASANVANLLLASATTRVQEIRTRVALGASRARVIRQLLTESAVLGLAAAGLAVVVTTWMTGLAVSLFGPEMAAVDLGIDWRVLAFLTGTSLLIGAGSGLLPALQGTRRTPVTIGRTRRFLLGVQAAASIMLLILTSLFTRALIESVGAPAPFEGDRIVRLTAAPRGETSVADRDFYAAAAERVLTVPGVEAVSLVERSPYDDGTVMTVTESGRPYRMKWNRSDAALFDLLDLTLLKGRAYTTHEVATSAAVAVIDRSVERDFWPDGTAVGSTLARVSADHADVRIVGVVEGAPSRASRSGAGAAPVIYLPLAPTGTPRILARIATATDIPLVALKDSVAALDAGRWVTAGLLSEDRERGLQVPRLVASIAGLVGGIALALAVVGMFGVTAVMVAARRRDIGIRLAIGASRHAVVASVFAEGMRPVVIGLVCGLLLAWQGAQVFASFLWAGVSPRDPLSFAVAACVLLATACAGVLIPARRAAAVNPVESLRAE